MSTTNTKVNPAKFVAICNKVGLSVVKQPSQYKITGANPNHRFYIPGTKLVHKVELSGFSHELAITWEKAFPGKKAPSSKITHVLDFNQDEKLILRAFYKIAKSIAPKAEPVVPSSPVVEEAVASEPVLEQASA